MIEKKLRYIFIFGTLFFLGVLIALGIDTLAQVKSARTPALSESVIAGKQHWQQQNCNDCHTILGIGGYFAPELTKVAQRRDATWLRSFLLDPQVAKPGSTMPNQALTALQADQLLSFFQWVSQIDTNEWPPQPQIALGGGTSSGNAGASDQVLQGQQIYNQKGCNACHMINGQGASTPGPDLSRIGSQPYDALPNDPEFIRKWLENPVAQKPTTTMPRIELTSGEIDALVAYLTSLK
jgi:nitric oxide reductase subunit C